MLVDLHAFICLTYITNYKSIYTQTCDMLRNRALNDKQQLQYELRAASVRGPISGRCSFQETITIQPHEIAGELTTQRFLVHCCGTSTVVLTMAAAMRHLHDLNSHIFEDLDDFAVQFQSESCFSDHSRDGKQGRARDSEGHSM